MGGLPNYRRISHCLLCGGARLHHALKLKAMPLPNAYLDASLRGQPQPIYPVGLHLCLDCGQVQLVDIVDPRTVYEDNIYTSRSSLGFVQHFERYAADLVAAERPAPGSLAVDIGSNDGLLLEAFQKLGLRVLGVEPAARIARLAEEAGVPTLVEYMGVDLARRMVAEHGPARLVTVNNLLANLDDVDELMRSALILMGPDAVLVAETGSLSAFMDNMGFDTFYHEHISYLWTGPVARLAQRHGLELVDAVVTASKGGSQRYVMQRAGAGRKPSQALGRLMAQERALGLGGPEIFARYQQRMAEAQAALAGLLDAQRDAGRRIVGYGASSSTTPLVYQFGLDAWLEYLVDDNPDKIGTVSPGKHIPVRHPQELYSDKPGCVCVTGWRYWRPIVAKHKEFARQGGVFVLPLPEPRLLTAADLDSI